MRKLGHKALSLLATGALGLAGAAAFAAPASAATNATGTENVTLTAGSLSVGSVGSPVTLTAGVGGATAIGSGPTALYQDATGSGTGWNATAGVGSFTFNGPWVETQGSIRSRYREEVAEDIHITLDRSAVLGVQDVDQTSIYGHAYRERPT